MLLVSCGVVGVWLCWGGLIVGGFGCFDLLVGWILLVAFEFLVECLCGCLVLSLSLGVVGVCKLLVWVFDLSVRVSTHLVICG